MKGSLSMFRIFKHRKKMNHKGMTLVEVIVAMAILAAVVVPTLHMFVSASGNNLRSKLRQRATFVGESVMESFKAYDVEALCNQFKNSTFGGVTTCSTTTMKAEGYYGPTNGYQDALLFNKELNRDAEHYLFTAKDVVSEGHHYDVRVIATPDEQPSVLRYESPNAYTDAIIMLPESINTEAQTYFTTEAVNQFNTNYPNGTKVYTMGEVTFSNFERTITINVTDSSGVQKVEVSVQCKCDANVAYTWTSTGGAGGTVANGGGDAPFSLTYDVIMPPENTASTDTVWVAYDNSSTISGQAVNDRVSKLDNIYLYYYPAYDSIFGSSAKDIINFKGNLSSLYDPTAAPKGASVAEENGYGALNIYVNKQKSTKLAGSDLDSAEFGYRLTVNENITGGKINFISNLRENISGGTAVITQPTINGFTEVELKDQMADEVQLLYTLDVYVYEAGAIDAGAISADDELVHFTSTKND